MTNALQDSLVNALERGYNVSSIVNSLASVESAARSAKEALDAMNNAASGGGSGYSGGGGGDTSSSGSDSDSGSSVGTGSGWTKPDRSPTPPSGRPKPPQKATVSYEITSSSGKVLTTLDHYPSQEELATLRARFADQLGANKNLKVNKVGGYANGVHRLDKDEVAWTQEKGDELILSPDRNAMLTPLKRGDTVLTAEQTDNLYKMSKVNPDNFISLEQFEAMNSDSMQRLWANARMSEPVVDKRMSAPIYNYFESMLTINGDVNDLKNLKAQMQEIADRSSIKASNNSIRRLAEGIRR